MKSVNDVTDYNVGVSVGISDVIYGFHFPLLKRRKELSLCHKLWLPNTYIFEPQFMRLIIFQTMNCIRLSNLSVKYQRFSSLDCQVIGITRLDCQVIGITQLDCQVIGITRLDCQVIGIIQLDCQVIGITRLDCQVMV